jgi:periplasmic copper chaperone A
MRMRPLPSGLEIKPGETVLMLENLQQPIQRGKNFKATLMFAKAGSADFSVESPGATTGAAPTHDGHH